MRRFVARLLCALGLHAWHRSTLGDPFPIEYRHCLACEQWQVREWEEWAEPVWISGAEDLGPQKGQWSGWQSCGPQPEPWGPVV